MKSAYEKALENIENDTIPIAQEFKIDSNESLEIRTILDDWMKSCGYNGQMLFHTQEQLEKLINILCDYFNGNTYEPQIRSLVAEWRMLHYGNTGYTEHNIRWFIENILKRIKINHG